MYKSEDIKVLDEITHIRTNSGMYIGDTSTPVHLIEEALDNSLDECLGGFANIIFISIDTKKNIFSVTDNGRGMPIDNDVPVIVSTKLFSGAKFKAMKTAYEICSGLHGVGLVAVNALCDWMEISIYRDGKEAVFSFKDAKVVKKSIKQYDNDPPYSTCISFSPSKRRFQTLIPDISRIRKRLLVASAELGNCKFILEIDGEQELIKLSSEQYFKEHCVGDQNGMLEPIYVEAKHGVETVKVRFSYSTDGSIAPKILSSVNLLHLDGGGNHVIYFTEILKKIFVSKGKKLNYKFFPQDCLCGLRTYLSMTLKEPEFSAQTKDKLINQKVYLDKLFNQVENQIEKEFTNKPELLASILSHFDQYRKRVEAKRIKVAKHSKRASTKFTKLRDCTSSRGILFIVEGDSAEGGLLQCRDPKVHAIFPLRGKIPSIANAKDILKNKEIGELIQSFGTGVGPNFDITKLKYETIVCAVDADADGGHIFCLLTIALANLVPQVIKNGHYYLARMPLYAINENKNFIPLWSEKELEDARKSKRSITRFKGLGELSPWQLKICAIDPDSRRWEKISFSSDLDNIMKLFTDVQAKRELLLSD